MTSQDALRKPVQIAIPELELVRMPLCLFGCAR